MSTDQIEKISSSRSLRVTEKIKDEFNEIRNFGNFQKMVFHRYFHYFYSVSVAYNAMLTQKELKNHIFLDDDINFLEEMRPINNDTEIMAKSASIDSPQLKHHDDLFKVIAYWYRMKMDDPNCFKVLVAPDNKEWKENYDPRMICEKFFIRGWKEFRDKIGSIGTDFPDVLMYMKLLREKQKE